MRGQKRDFALALIFADILRARARAKLEGKKKGKGKTLRAKIQQQKNEGKN